MSSRSLDTRLGSANNDRTPGTTPVGGATVNRNTYLMAGADVDSGAGPERGASLSRDLLIKAIGFGVVGAGALILAMVGLFLLLTAIYFHDPGPYAQNSWQGYDAKSFAGLMLFVICAPLGYVTTYSSVQAVARARGGLGVWLYATLGAGSIVVGCSAMVWGKETMQCLGMFCVGSAEKWLEVPNARPEAGLGFLSTLGTSAFFSLVPFGFIILFQATRYLRSPAAANVMPSASDPLVRRQEGGTARHVFVLRENRTATFVIAGAVFVFLQRCSIHQLSSLPLPSSSPASFHSSSILFA